MIQQGRCWIPFLALLIAFSAVGLDAHALGSKKPAPIEDSWGNYSPRPQKTAAAIEHGSTVLRVMTYNIWGLPLPGVDPTRFTDIGTAIANARAKGVAPHIIVLQEAFHERASDIIKIARYPYVAYGPSGKGVRFNAGLVVLSEYPIVLQNSTIFSFCTSWDCFSRKGVMQARVTIPGMPQPLEIFNTHLNADPDTDFWTPIDDARDARFTQSQEVREFLWQTRLSQAPIIFAGDFNFFPGDWDYQAFAGSIDLRNAVEDCGRYYKCTGSADPIARWSKVVDHHFYASGKSPAVSVTPIHFEEQFTEKVKNRALSDHSAVVVHYKLAW